MAREARFAFGVGFVGIGLLGALLPLWAMYEEGPSDAWWGLHWVGVAMLAFVAFVGTSSYAWTRTRERVGELGRRGGGALLLLGLAAAMEATGLLGALAAAVTGGAVRGFFIGVMLALAAALAADLVLEVPRFPPRPILTVGAGLGAAAAWFQGHVAVTGAGLMIAVLVLFQTWTKAPPTRPAAAIE